MGGILGSEAVPASTFVVLQGIVQLHSVDQLCCSACGLLYRYTGTAQLLWSVWPALQELLRRFQAAC